ncbi:hypothetical protein ANN_04216 [Periplaneta americana]|uniref:Uncharacterized protein n=1 Tax=Periplaneta americana TaxID=6978 RepID=A0ABQ8T9S3_PERAM|nr:hypothetical protein ANN_04216 [Periplaneta americana]
MAGLYEGGNEPAGSLKANYDGSATWPYNHNVFVDEDFAPDELTDRPLETEISEMTAGSDLTNSAVPASSAAEETVNAHSESTTSVIDEIFNTSITLRFSLIRFARVSPKPCIVGRYQHCMACAQVADRGDGIQIWRVAANILNKQSWTADEGWSSNLGVGRRANNRSPMKFRLSHLILRPGVSALSPSIELCAAYNPPPLLHTKL